MVSGHSISSAPQLERIEKTRHSNVLTSIVLCQVRLPRPLFLKIAVSLLVPNKNVLEHNITLLSSGCVARRAFDVIVAFGKLTCYVVL
jgi:hypothetical protein